MENLEQEFQSYLNFKDITSLFHEVCEGLTIGEMIHSENFNLHDSMSSSELCDAKMDLKIGYKEVVHPSQQISQKTIKSANDLSNVESILKQKCLYYKQKMICLLDNVLAQEFMWLKGYSLSQTLYKFVQDNNKQNIYLRYSYPNTLLQIKRQSKIFQHFDLLYTLQYYGSQFYMFADCSIFMILLHMKIIKFLKLTLKGYSQVELSYMILFVIHLTQEKMIILLLFLDFQKLKVYFLKQQYKDIQQVKKLLDEQNLTNAITNAEKSLEDKMTNINTRKKKNLPMNEYDAIDARLKYRKAFLKLVHIMSNQNFTPQIEEQLQSQINGCKKRLEEIKQTYELYGKNSNVNASVYFQKELSKSLNCLISPRPPVEVTIEEGFSMAENFFNTLEYVLSLSKERDFNQIIERIKEFNTFPKNILSKAYLDINIFYTPQKYFSQFELSEMVKNVFRDYGLKDSNFTVPSFKEYNQQCCIVLQEYICKHLRNPYRQYRDFSKMYQDLSILISLSNNYEKEYLTKKDEQLIATSWSYSLACKLMANQLHLGFQLELYDQADYSQVFYALEYVYSILERYSQQYLFKIDKQMMISFHEKQNIDLLKKKLKPFQRRTFNYYVFYGALSHYCRASSRLCYLLEKLKLVPDFNDSETKRNRFINRYKIFENVYFLKFASYEEFLQKMSEICPNIEDVQELSNGLVEVKEIFTQAQQLFQKIPQDDETITVKMRSEAKQLVRICIMSSMTALKIKNKIGNLNNLKGVYKNQDLQWYPQIEIV